MPNWSALTPSGHCAFWEISFPPILYCLRLRCLVLGRLPATSAKWNSCILPLLLLSPQPLILFQWRIFTFGNSCESEQLVFPLCCSCISCFCRRGQRKQGWGDGGAVLSAWVAEGQAWGQPQLAPLVRRRFAGEAWQWCLHSSVSVLGTVEMYTEIWSQW